MAEQSVSQGVLLTPELLKIQQELVACQGRFLVGGEALNPNNLNLPQITKEQIVNFEKRDYTPYNNASTRERIDWWQKKTQPDGNLQDRQTQYQHWETETINEFKKEGNTDSINKLNLLGQKIGLNFSEMDSIKLEKFYDRYFRNYTLPSYKESLVEGVKEYVPSNVKQFVADILEAYKENGIFNYEKLKEDISAIQWLAAVFGETSAEMITQLIYAEAKFQTQPDVLIQQVNKDNRINDLKPDEEKLLAFVWGGQRTVGKVEPKLLTEEKLAQQVTDLKKGFEEKAQKGQDQIVKAETFTTGGDAYIYQKIAVKENFRVYDEAGNDRYWRGYFMIEKEDIPQAVRLMMKIASERANNNLPTKFKWLVGLKNWGDKIEDHIGDYTDIDDEIGRVVVYGRTKQEIEDILTSMAKLPEWQAIEDRRMNNRPIRRPGTSALEIKPNGTKKLFRSLCHGEQPGFSEYAAYDPLWRLSRKGDFSLKYLSPEIIRQQIEQAEDRMRRIYNLDPNIILVARKLIHNKITEIIRRQGKLPVSATYDLIKPTDEDITEVVKSIESEKACKDKLAEIRNIYSLQVTDDEVIHEFIHDMYLLKLQN